MTTKNAVLLSMIISNAIPLSAMLTPARLPKILRLLEKGKYKKINKAQARAITILRQNPDMPLAALNDAINILLFGNRIVTHKFDIIARNIYLIDAAIKNFDSTPGFRRVLIQSLSGMGFPFSRSLGIQQMHVALDIVHSSADERVCAFGKPYVLKTNLCRFALSNVITNKRWINCLNQDWSTIKPESKRGHSLIKQLVRLHQIIVEYNETKQNPLTHELDTKFPLTPEWHAWFTSTNISVPNSLTLSHP